MAFALFLVRLNEREDVVYQLFGGVSAAVQSTVGGGAVGARRAHRTYVAGVAHVKRYVRFPSATAEIFIMRPLSSAGGNPMR